MRWSSLRALIKRQNLFPHHFDRREQHLVIASVVVGAVVWAVVHALKLSVHFVFERVLDWTQQAATPLVILLPLVAGSLVTAFLASWRASNVYYRDESGRVHALNDIVGDGLERTIALYYTSEPALDRALYGVQGVRARWELPTFSLALRKFLATLATLGTGGSGGLEASVTLIGESLAVGLFKPRFHLLPHRLWALRLWRWWRTLDPDELQTVQLSGVAAAVATLVGAPLAGAFFAVEAMYRRRPVIEKFIYALVAALTTFFLGRLFTPHPGPFLQVDQVIDPPAHWRYYLFLVTLAVLVALVDFYQRRLRSAMSNFFRNQIGLSWRRHALGALLTGVIGLLAAWLTGEPLDLTLGTGDRIVAEALGGQLTLQVAIVALIGKLLTTMSTITSGGSAGMLIPSIYLGSMVGVIVAQMGGYPAAMLVIPSITGSLVSLINVPLTALLMTVEIFGVGYLLPALVVLLITLLLSHPTSVYRTQRDRDESREILPGYTVRRIIAPPAWEGRTLRDLDLRARYDVNVIGYIAQREQTQQLVPHIPATQPLHAGDRLVVLGSNEAIGHLLADLLNTPRLPEEVLQEEA